MPTQTSKQPIATLPAGYSILRADDRGRADMGWLQARYSFSFANYINRDYMHFEALRVINDDRIGPGGGFPMHPHANFEIFSYILDGALAHEDSMGNGSTVKAGGVQYMSAGRGVRHSEFNPVDTTTRLLQVWLMPNVKDEAPRYETQDIPAAEKDGRLRLILSPDGREGSIRFKADADIYAATLDGDQAIDFKREPGRHVWLQMARGEMTVNGHTLYEGDSLAVTAPDDLKLSGGSGAEFLLFDLDKWQRR